MAKMQFKSLPSVSGSVVQKFALGLLVGSCCGLLTFLLFTPQRYSDFLLWSLKGPMSWDDPELLLYIQNEMLVPPSDQPYELLGSRNPANHAIELSELYYDNITKHIFKGMRGGTFIEAGALDGETMSNTLLLERKYGWSGLLVEADPVSYGLLTTKNRKAWSVNGCLSPKPFPSSELMSSHSHYTGPNSYSFGTKQRAMHSLFKYQATDGMAAKSWYKKVQCVPLGSVLRAMDLQHVDLLVLDVEGAELDILEHFDFKKFTIDVMYIEWKKKIQHQMVKEKIEARGYRLIGEKGEDLVFVRQKSKYDTGMFFNVTIRSDHVSKILPG